ncbi:ISL3 family transposase [Stenotrophomonas maltophilia]|uniref:ISL3 family transposase n=1 Tax=Stenotrophomonas maltophilia TaxID=40324 RepID=UPI0013DC0DFD|nr:ISL3 family transposase [Stenotrophomonas maltophilia]
MEALFTQALGLSPPWAVVSVDFRQSEGAIHFAVECQAKRLACPACGAADQPIHDRIKRRWQHLHFFQFRAFIHAPLPRVACAACGKTGQVQPPWARPGSGFSLVIEAFVIALCQAMPVAHVARLVGGSDDRVWRLLRHHIDQARAREDYSTVKRVGVDETSSRRGQRYITLFHDADAARLLFATPGRNAATFSEFIADLQAHGGDAGAISDLSMDMSRAFQAGAARHCPQARVTFDPFHVVALAGRALDQVRRAEVKAEPDLKGSRWALLKDSERWSYKQLCTMHWLQRSGLKTARAWHLKQALRRLYAAGLSPEEADHQLDRWISWARRSRLPPFKRLGATLREHKAGIIEHFRSGLTNASVEAMNAQIQAAKARAKGYATHENLIAIAYLLCAKLKHLPRNPWLAPAAA